MNRQLDREMDALTHGMAQALASDFPNARLAHRPDKGHGTATDQIDATIAFLETQIEALLEVRRRL